MNYFEFITNTYEARCRFIQQKGTRRHEKTTGVGLALYHSFKLVGESGINQLIDNALFNKRCIEDFYYDFVKQFRQIDATESGDLDMILWNLLQEKDGMSFWKLMHLSVTHHFPEQLYTDDLVQWKDHIGFLTVNRDVSVAVASVRILYDNSVELRNKSEFRKLNDKEVIETMRDYYAL